MEFALKLKKNTLPFVTGYILSAFGYEFIFFVITVYIFNLTKSALNVSLFTALLVFSKFFLPFSGTITDRFRKENSFGFALLITSIFISLLFFVRNIYGIYALWFMLSFLFTFIVNIRTALMTEIMPAESFLKGNSTVFVSLNIAKIASPLIGGILADAYDPQILFLFTGFIYFMAFIASRSIHIPAESLEAEEIRTIDQIKKALKFIRNTPNLRSLGWLLFTRALFIGFQITMFVTYIKSYLGLGSAQYGLFLSISGIGSIVGSILGPYISKRFDKFYIITIGLLLHYSAFILLGLNQSYEISLMIIFISSIIFYIAAISVHSIRDSSTETSLRGTVYGIISALNSPAAAASMIAGGYFINIFGINKVLIFSGGASILSMLAISFVFRTFKFSHAQNEVNGYNKYNYISKAMTEKK